METAVGVLNENLRLKRTNAALRQALRSLEKSVGGTEKMVSSEEDDGLIFELSDESCIVDGNLDVGEVLGNSAHTIHVELDMPVSFEGARQWILNLGQEGKGANHWIWNERGDDGVQFGRWGSKSSQVRDAHINSCKFLTTTYGDGELNVYCNGVLIASKPASFNIKSSKLAVASNERYESGKGDFKGCVTEVKVWNRELTALEVSSEGMEYVCEYFYASSDCSDPVLHYESKKYYGCQPYLFEEAAAGMFYDMQSGGRCEREGDVCVNCEVYAEPMTPDMFAGEENEECRNQVRLGLSEDAVIPSWNFRPGPCPNMCEFMYEKFPECAEDYDGDIPCEPSQDVIDFAPHCFDL